MADIGIIGGADGPTAVLVVSHFSWLWVGVCVLAAVAVILAVVLYKRKK